MDHHWTDQEHWTFEENEPAQIASAVIRYCDSIHSHYPESNLDYLRQRAIQLKSLSTPTPALVGVESVRRAMLEERESDVGGTGHNVLFWYVSGLAEHLRGKR